MSLGLEFSGMKPKISKLGVNALLICYAELVLGDIIEVYKLQHWQRVNLVLQCSLWAPMPEDLNISVGVHGECDPMDY